DGAGRAGEHSDGIHGECHRSDRDEPEHWDAGGDAHACRGGRGRDVRQSGDRQGGDRLHADGDGGRERDQHGVQHHGGDGDPARVHRGAEHHGGGGGDHAGGAGNGAGRAREHGDRVHGERHGGGWEERREGEAGGDGERGSRRWSGDVRGVEHRQGGDRLHADGDGGRERDQRGIQHHGGDGDPARVHRGADHHGGGGGDHAGCPGNGAGRAREHGDRVHGERHGG